MDNIIVYGANQAEHDERLEAVLIRPQEANFTLNGEKCEFLEATIKFLVQLEGTEGFCTDPGKVSAVKHIAEPTDTSPFVILSRPIKPWSAVSLKEVL